MKITSFVPNTAIKSLALAAIIGVTTLAPAVNTASAGGAKTPTATVNGGGTADFLNIEGFTDFAIAATVYSDGSAIGHWMCEIPGGVMVAGDISGGIMNPNGSVTVTGVAHGYLHPDLAELLGLPAGIYTDCPFKTTLWAGGRGVGKFNYQDCSFPGFPDATGDTELVRRGGITIRTR